MCFSATASLAAGTFLLGFGVMTLHMAKRRHELAYAAIPLLFALQQLTEGVVWLTFGPGLEPLNTAAAQLYSFFSHVLWPVYVPAAVWLLEDEPPRRRALGATAAAGLAVGLYLLYTLLADGIVARPTGQHIEYDARHLYIPVVMALYLLATTGSLLLSSHRGVQLFGVLAFAASVVAYLFYARWFISVWCFLAAVLSMAVALHLAQRRLPPPALKP
ncbi:DUF6629 family protein [Azohydromonas caseinilytica]|uniref:Uncharacterized protein n=1 Tax=Azohydromonas caseinilytica TaxID=2728836 RepID=A0A848FD77_9BURK|nr:DUF6629 family protein [Azohydromonas caseinilytica]NML16946.1 hypothetical protein [Azohydromonas caseinilytica]